MSENDNQTESEDKKHKNIIDILIVISGAIAFFLGFISYSTIKEESFKTIDSKIKYAIYSLTFFFALAFIILILLSTDVISLQ